MYFCTLCPSIDPKERSRQALNRLPLVSNFLTNFWMQHFDSARLSPNSVRNAVWNALNEPVCQYLRTRNPRFSTVFIDNSLGPLARDSPCIMQLKEKMLEKIILYSVCNKMISHFVLSDILLNYTLHVVYYLLKLLYSLATACV